MALAVFLRGVNVGGHRAFRPTVLAAQLKHLDTVNIGAAGTFVVRRPVTRARLQAEIRRRLPFDTEIMICEGRDIVRLVSRNPFADYLGRRDLVPFVSVLARGPRSTPALPVSFPPDGEWLLKILGCEGRFVLGVYRRHMRAIGHLGAVDRLYEGPATTRNWNTITAIAKVLGTGGEDAKQR